MDLKTKFPGFFALPNFEIRHLSRLNNACLENLNICFDPMAPEFVGLGLIGIG